MNIKENFIDTVNDFKNATQDGCIEEGLEGFLQVSNEIIRIYKELQKMGYVDDDMAEKYRSVCRIRQVFFYKITGNTALINIDGQYWYDKANEILLREVQPVYIGKDNTKWTISKKGHKTYVDSRELNYE